MIVQKIEMPTGQPLYLGERILHSLGVEAPASLKEGVLIAEVAMLGAAARHHDRVRHQVTRTPDQIAANRRNTLQRAACRRGVNPLRLAGAKILQEPWEG